MTDASSKCAGDRRKEFVVISIRLMCAAPSPIWREISNSSRPDAAAVDEANPVAAISSPAVPTKWRSGIAPFIPFGAKGTGFGDITVISDGAEILKRLPRAIPKPTAYIIDWFHSPSRPAYAADRRSVDTIPH
ncbi:hypothetical protein [Mesorhizobium sp. L48C026A00]|uniref:hypothetical protein n=1 Tax=Mesorhizobium sp. L48C026A00 TaxID=1287182 RepID=UPI0012EB5324|nr:hypothetical protein [Mesorhizobium sp. L48C026A00]